MYVWVSSVGGMGRLEQIKKAVDDYNRARALALTTIRRLRQVRGNAMPSIGLPPTGAKGWRSFPGSPDFSVATGGYHGPRAGPRPGDPVPHSFIAQPGRCFRLVYSAQLQATHCRQEPGWIGRWFM